MSGSPRSCSGTEVSARDSHGGEGRIKTARFPARKTLEEFDFTFQRSREEDGDRAPRPARLPARPRERDPARPARAPARPTSRSRSRSAPASPASASQFATATQWVARLGEAKRQGKLEAELRRLSFIPLIVVDEVGYIPFDPEAANLMFSPGLQPLRARLDDRHQQQAVQQSAQVRVKVWAVVCSAHTFANAAASLSTAPIR